MEVEVKEYKHGTYGRNAVALAKNVRAIAFDSDGVFTDNTESFGYGSDAIVKSRSHYDGQGISLLRAVGIQVAVITGETGNGAALIEHLVRRWNSLPSTKSATNPNGWEPITLYIGCRDAKKLEALNEWCTQIGVSLEECAVMGDDLVDVPMLKAVPLRAAPASADYAVREMVEFVSVRPGGRGAVRDFVNFIFSARGLNSFDYPTS
jgi:3-deoxy-D-manno-octulosonate 8-phosphate phosphatase (KDO 8-P phosphatase)